MEQNVTASLRRISSLLYIQKASGSHFKYLVLICPFVLSFHLGSYSLLYQMQTVHFTAEELLTGQFSSWAEIQCSSPSPSGLQEHSSMPNRIHPDCSRLGQQIFLQLLDITGANKHGSQFTILKSTQNAEVDPSQ